MSSLPVDLRMILDLFENFWNFALVAGLVYNHTNLYEKPLDTPCDGVGAWCCWRLFFRKKCWFGFWEACQ